MGTPINITLGDKTWTIRPLTLGQIRELEPVIAGEKSSADKASEIIKVALKRDHAEASAALSDVETTVQELSLAASSVLELSGFLKRKPATGEAEAPATGGAG